MENDRINFELVLE